MAGSHPGRDQVFWSYVHADDHAEHGAISRLPELLAGQVGLHWNTDLGVFIDGGGIRWGGAWTPTLDAALHGATFFIPVITPRYFASQFCRKELTVFAALEERGDRPRFILPILWARVPHLDRAGTSGDPLIDLIKGRQHVDWRPVARQEPYSTPHREGVYGLATELAKLDPTFGTGSRSAAATSEAALSLGSVQGPVAPVTVDEALGALDGEVRKVRLLLEELGDTLEGDALMRYGQPGRPRGFAEGIVAAGWLAPQVETLAAELREVAAILLARVRAADAAIAPPHPELPWAPEDGDRAVHRLAATDTRAVDRRTEELDLVARTLRDHAARLTDGTAWSPELRQVGERLADAVTHLSEASSILQTWLVLTR